MRNFLAQLTGQGRQDFRLLPEQPLQIIGDIHGRADLLSDMFSILEPSLPIVCVGDYVDRGDDSNAVLQMLVNRPNTTCLMGNHEFMLLGFLADPRKNGRAWLRHGGLETLASYGITGVRTTSRDSELDRVRAQLISAMGKETLSWLADRPLSSLSGNIAIAHAGLDPSRPVDDQSPSDLIWGHPDFRRKRRKDGFSVVVGHTIVGEPMMENGRISIDTGAYATNRLTAALIDEEQIEFVST